MIERTVRVDTFDTKDWDHTVEAMPGVRRAVNMLDDAGRYGEDLAADVHAALVRDVVKFRDDAPTSRIVNRTVVEELVGSDQYLDLHAVTMSDPVASGGGVMSLTTRLCELVRKLGDVQDKADEAQGAEDRLEQALSDQATGAGGSDDDCSDLEGEIEQMRAEAEATKAALDQALDDHMPGISKAVREAVGQAAEEAADQAEAAATWGLDPGSAARMDPEERIRLTEQINTRELREIAKLFGAFRAMQLGVRDKRFDRDPDEIHDVVLGDDLSRLVPAEMVGFAIPELEDDLTLRLLERQARVYELRGNSKAGHGAIIYLSDASGSMGGRKGTWATAFGMALYAAARDQGRAFHAISFRGPGELQRFDFPDAKTPDPKRLLEFASVQPGGGTCWQTPLDEAVHLLEDQYLQAGSVEGDIILATDDEAAVKPDWLAGHLETKERLKFNTFGVGIAGRITNLATVADFVAHVHDLASPDATRDVFKVVSR